MELVLQTVVNSLIVSVFYALIALGLCLVCGVMGVLNLAHGELYMAGAYVVWLTYAQGGLPFPLAIIVAMAVVAGISLALERSIFRPTRDRPHLGLIASIGVIFILQVIVAQVWGVGLTRHVPSALKGAIEIFGVSAPWQRLIVIPAATTLLIGLWFFLHRSKAGRALRATAQDPEAARLAGVNINKSGAIAMGLGGILVGAAGAFMSPLMSVTPYMGHSVIINTIAILIVGGLASIEGVLLASFIFGFLHTFMNTYVGGTLPAIAGVLLMFIVLIVRPRGILGRA